MRRSPSNAKPRFCDCGGRLRYRDARKYSIPGVPVGAHRWVCESCGAVRTRWQAASPEERERERAQSRRASAAFRRRVRALIAEAKDKPCADCGHRFASCAMDLDHVRGAKSFTVSKAVQLAFATTLPRVRREIAKCEVVVRTAIEFAQRRGATSTVARHAGDRTQPRMRAGRQLQRASGVAWPVRRSSEVLRRSIRLSICTSDTANLSGATPSGRRSGDRARLPREKGYEGARTSRYTAARAAA